MQVKDAVVWHFQNLCAARNICFNELATRSGVTPSTVYSMMDLAQRGVSVPTIKKLCDGLDVTITEFSTTKFF